MNKKIIKQYKFLRTGMKSENGNQVWKLRKWARVEGELELCKLGFHSSEEPYDAFSYVQGEILAIVECRGEHLKDDNKYCWREQRVIKTYKWTKKDSVRLAIYSAEQVLHIFEKEYPNDNRPRKAIVSAKKWLKNPTEKNRVAAVAYAYAAARAVAYAYAAARAVAYAAYAAYAAAYAAAVAYAAADAAAVAYAYAADAADAAVDARKLLILKIQKYFMKIVKEKMK